MGLLVGVAHVARALAGGSVAFCSATDGPLPTWAAFASSAAVARAARTAVYERVSLQALRTGGVASTVAGSLAMEACLVMSLLPCLARSRRALVLLCLFSFPVLLLLAGGPAGSALEAQLEDADALRSFAL